MRKITDSFVDSQKEILVNSFRLWSDWMISPRQVTENIFYYLNFILNKSNNVLKKTTYYKILSFF